MKLTDIEIFVVGNPPPRWGGRYFIFVKLATDNGLIGYGEVYAASVGAEAMCVVIKDAFERHMLDKNPESVAGESESADVAFSKSDINFDGVCVLVLDSVILI